MTGVEPRDRELDPKDLPELSEGDEIRICYESVYAETTQILEAEVSAVDIQVSTTGDVTWFDVLLDLGKHEDRLRDRKRETYRSHKHLRKLSGNIDDTGGWVGLYALNGGRWHNISERESVAVLETRR